MRIVVVGAGSIGCHLGGLLAANPTTALTLVGRPAIGYAVDTCGLTTGTPDGRRATTPAGRVTMATDLTGEVLAATDLVIVTVKAKDTDRVGRQLAAAGLPPTTPVLCLQNGLHGTDRLAAALPDHRMLAGMVPFNVVHERPATFLRTTSGTIVVDADPALDPLVATARGAGLTLRRSHDMAAVHTAKLLLNLNNAVNALSGRPLRDELADRDFRRVLAASQREALAVLAAEGRAPARLTPLPASLMPSILEAPTPIFRVLARTALSVHPQARSSMADDLELARPTEIAELQGEVSRLGRVHGLPTPVSDALVRLVRAAELAGPDRRAWSGAELRQAVTTAGDAATA